MRDARQLKRFEDVPVTVEAAIEGFRMRVGEILALEPGSVVTSPRRAGENVSLFAAGALVGYAELAQSGTRATLRLVKVGNR